MERQLDSQGGAVLARVLRGMGIEFRLGRTATKYWPGKGLELDDGSVVEAGLVVVSAGTRPASGLAAAAGLTVDRGIVIDDELRTSDHHVRAIGDCARHTGTVGGLVQPAWEQASVLAELLTGADPDSRYLGTQVVMRLKTRDVDLATMGEVHVEPDCLDAEVVRIEDPARGRYAKIVLREDRITGAIVLGAPDAAATITQLHDQGTPAPSDRMALLLGRAMPAGSEIPAVETNPAGLPASTLICRCNTVDKGRIVAAWRSGARSVEDLVGATHASTGCGGCRTAVGKLCEWLTDQNPPPRKEEKLGSNQR
jgi:assimilatory nitrate reductase electron transfer subunit